MTDEEAIEQAYHLVFQFSLENFNSSKALYSLNHHSGTMGLVEVTVPS